MDLTYHPIGIIHSGFTSLNAMPIQPLRTTSTEHARRRCAPYVARPRTFLRAKRCSSLRPICILIAHDDLISLLE